MHTRNQLDGGGLHVVIDSIACELLNVRVDHPRCNLSEGRPSYFSVIVKKNRLTENIRLTWLTHASVFLLNPKTMFTSLTTKQMFLNQKVIFCGNCVYMLTVEACIVSGPSLRLGPNAASSCLFPAV